MKEFAIIMKEILLLTRWFYSTSFDFAAISMECAGGYPPIL
jgi:hypothetical protein